MTLIAPSLLAADFRNLTLEFDRINSSGADWLHYDVMDGTNVPNISFGFPILSAVQQLCQIPIDVHLMIERPERYFSQFVKLGAHNISIPYKNQDKIEDKLNQIRDLGISSGLALNPDTPIEVIEPLLASIDVLLVMSVYPGFGGQKFIETTYSRVAEAKKLIDSSGYQIQIEVDGGVSIDNSAPLIAAGADILVCGSALFGQSDYSSYIAKLKQL